MVAVSDTPYVTFAVIYRAFTDKIALMFLFVNGRRLESLIHYLDLGTKVRAKNPMRGTESQN